MRSQFRPCIDLHNGQVKQIVGGTLHDTDVKQLQTNFVSTQPAEHYARMYKESGLLGGHVIMLGPHNDTSAMSALSTYPDALQVGGGINLSNAQQWIDRGASKVIVTSWLFPDGKFSMDRLDQMEKLVGRANLVVDLSCRRTKTGNWIVAMNKWQTLTDMQVSKPVLEALAKKCSEFLVHAADVEGLCNGIDEDLVVALAEWSPIPVTYAGGASSIRDLQLVTKLSKGRVDLTIGSALDIFGGTQIKYTDCVEWNRTGCLPTEL
ncbi:Enzyme that catalyzes the fourth step in the histidine pathway [Coemansia sp. RSA 564]|nr:Enzyme that catalyzes the fourth step in the histidine pathway [Coemansia sp. RSA 564]KAJ2180736.1 Enzyme that catalyzes the fourth step in the histidine pathway [Coemansia sp. RSA 551]KAJ2189954.1 Enzyme that catalyzes the fourth step in the histidine pathway [Coemansia sp. RSA 532]